MATYAPIAISILSLLVSSYAVWRTVQAETPIFWIDVARTQKPEMYLATVSIRNRSKFDLRLETASVPIQAVPVTKKQDFTLVNYNKGLQILPDGTMGQLDVEKVERSIKFSFDHPKTVHPEDTEHQKFWLIRSPISTATEVKITFGCRIMKQTTQYKPIILMAKVPTDGIVLQIPTA